MALYTEARIRKMLRELQLERSGQLSLDAGSILTPSAKSFLRDHRINVSWKEVQSSKKAEFFSLPTDTLFRLEKVYPYFLKAQKVLRQYYLLDKEERLLRYFQQIQLLRKGEEIEFGFDRVQTDSNADRLMNHVLEKPIWALELYQLSIELDQIRYEYELAWSTELRSQKEVLLGQLNEIVAGIQSMIVE
ncbi:MULTISPECIES: hypothetical protein [unclassified Streptococcus]|uniref:hypothetical protein n=1 Tax=unclassified Streptococcus TaxID=2608887 RepID=UPI0018A9A113|nr:MULTISPECIES: hypothetical protein [unclassified Streptococcus]MBF8969694.1 hypothetical protein [Streptococcus sp. NLN76]MBG9366613.1 hypothetical protein [Streptococcus sp. NLN64]MBJ6744895.1 hypothetical protein [Streptococcus sp. 121]